jgi:hypothetical protein
MKISRSTYIAGTLAIVSLLITLALVEVTFRLTEYDFGGRLKAFEKIPIFQRIPTVPVGEIYFRRQGPAVWEGKVLEAALKRLKIADKAYVDEVPVKAYYDSLGFRNPEDLADWEIVVVGDSFTELGYLHYEDLFTTRMGELLGLKVKNLGASYAAPLTYNFYLSEYGKSANTKHAVMVFFEGNDLKGLIQENKFLANLLETGERPYRNVLQSSFVVALYELVADFADRFSNKSLDPADRYFRNAYYEPKGLGLEPIAVSVGCTPPNVSDLSDEHKQFLDDAISGWAETSRSHGLTPWFVYMPVKRRVLEGHLKFPDDTHYKVTDCKLSDFPALMEELADSHGIKFIDVTPALVAETNKGKLTYNPILDTHLNLHGSHIVGDVLASEIINDK